MVSIDPWKWILPLALLALAVLTWLLAPVLVPFLAAALLAYLGDPLVRRLVGWRMPRTLAVVLVFLAIFLGMGLLVLALLPLIERQVLRLAEVLPEYVARLVAWLQPRLAGLGLDPADGLGTLNAERIKALFFAHWREAGGVATAILGYVSRSGAVMLGWLANLLLIPVVTFYLLRDWEQVIERLRGLLPRPVEPRVSRIARESDEVLGTFFKGQFLVMLALAAIYSVGLWFAGLELALLIGLLAGMVSFVPYLGLIVGLSAAGVAMLLQTGDPLQLLWVAAVFGVGQILESVLLTPWLVGERIGLHPVAVIFAVMAGGYLFGFVGVLLALPAAAVIAVLLRHLNEGYRESGLYAGDESPPTAD
ncbi:MAG: AI-2E family transporter [Ectothiorhodospiraceae bacterium]|jgi:predicted PurR-regulated permease PerM|nr:AI-2E family transporter [Ectothiorhodospiraceae bacterium]